LECDLSQHGDRVGMSEEVDIGYQLRLPPEFCEEEWLYKSNGIVVVDVVGTNGSSFQIMVLEVGRLKQEIRNLGPEGYFESNLIIVNEVTLVTITAPTASLAEFGMKGLCPTET
jgi:DNA repair exonuclease SbcCD nuclease subunit